MRFISKYLKEYKIQSILAPLFKMCEAVFELLVPLVMASIINKGIANSDTAYIIRMSGVLVLLAVVGLGFSVVAQYFSALVAVNCSANIRKDLFTKILSLSSGQQEKVGSEVLTTRITSDVNQIQSAINMVLRLFLRSPFIVAGAVVMAAIIDPYITSVFIVVVLILSLIVYGIMKYTLPRYKLLQKKLERVLHATSENLSGARVLRAFRREDKELEEFEEKVGDLYSLQISNSRIATMLNPITYVVVNLGIVLVIYVGSKRVESGVILQGDVVALVNYMSQILVELVKLANLIVLLMKAFPSADRVEEILTMESDEREKISSDMIEARTSGGYSLRVENVSFSYNNSEDYDVDDISFELEKGSVLGIVGGTGSGKSTLLKLLNHTYDVSKGKISLNDIDIRQYSDEAMGQIFGIVPQKASLFKGTIRSNMTVKLQNATDEELKNALDVAKAIDFVMEKDGGLDAAVSQNGANFSGGQKQRLTIARALVGQPDILILDDSASALDLSTEAALRKGLLNLSWNPTIIIVSQRASSVRNADKILVLDDGKCVGFGNHDNLIKNCQEYEEIYFAQYPREEAEDGR